MSNLPNDIAMDGNLAETRGMGAQEAEKWDALQPEPKLCTATCVAKARQASQSSQLGNKPRVARRMASIKDSTSLLTIANYVKLRLIGRLTEPWSMGNRG